MSLKCQILFASQRALLIVPLSCMTSRIERLCAVSHASMWQVWERWSTCQTLGACLFQPVSRFMQMSGAPKTSSAMPILVDCKVIDAPSFPWILLKGVPLFIRWTVQMSWSFGTSGIWLHCRSFQHQIRKKNWARALLQSKLVYSGSMEADLSLTLRERFSKKMSMSRRRLSIFAHQLTPSTISSLALCAYKQLKIWKYTPASMAS